MDYTNLLNSHSGKASRVGLIGANQGFGYTLLAQMSKRSEEHTSELQSP